MPDEVESMAYTGETPWHGLGTDVPQGVSTEEMLQAAGLDWTVESELLYLKDNTEVPKMRALVRSTDRKVISIVGSTYKPTQNFEVLDFFRKFVEAGDMTLETAGSLQSGKYIWCLARVKREFGVGKDDEVRTYLLFCNPHIYGYGRIVKFTPIRVVCWNTLSFALSNTLRGKKSRGTSFSIPHSTKFDEKAKASVERALGLVNAQSDQFEAAVKHFAKVKMKKEQIENYFNDVVMFDPNKAKLRKDGSAFVPSMVLKFKEHLEIAPGQDLKSCKGTLWGALNAVTFTIDHDMGRSRDNGLTSAWFGYTEDIKARAFDLAVLLSK